MLFKCISCTLGGMALVSVLEIADVLTPAVNWHIESYKNHQRLIQDHQRLLESLQAQLDHIPEAEPLNSSLFANAAYTAGEPPVDQQRAWSDLETQVALVPEVEPLSSSLLAEPSDTGSLPMPERTQEVVLISKADKVGKSLHQLASKDFSNQDGSRPMFLHSVSTSAGDTVNRNKDKSAAPGRLLSHLSSDKAVGTLSSPNKTTPLVRLTPQSPGTERRKTKPVRVLAVSAGRSKVAAVELPEALRPIKLR